MKRIECAQSTPLYFAASNKDVPNISSSAICWIGLYIQCEVVHGIIQRREQTHALRKVLFLSPPHASPAKLLLYTRMIGKV